MVKPLAELSEAGSRAKVSNVARPAVTALLLFAALHGSIEAVGSDRHLSVELERLYARAVGLTTL